MINGHVHLRFPLVGKNTKETRQQVLQHVPLLQGSIHHTRSYMAFYELQILHARSMLCNNHKSYVIQVWYLKYFITQQN